MVTKVVPALDDLLGSAQEVALHLEMRDTYAGSSPAFTAWKSGEPYDRSRADAAWHELIRPLVSQGVDVRRARIVSEPVTDYIRFEYEVTPAANLAAGEQVRWLPRRKASNLVLPGNDFWIVDGSVLWIHFSGDGEFIDEELSTDPEILKFCRAAFEAVWECATPHEEYRPG